MSSRIFCDESGFTGDHLLNRDQPIFVYASVNLDDDTAEQILARAFSAVPARQRVGEAKASKLIKSSAGRRPITSVLRDAAPHARVMTWDKKFSLAAWLFEHTIEPLFSAGNSLFYAIGFHRYIALVLYCDLAARSQGALELFEGFEAAVRGKGVADFLKPKGSSLKLPDMLGDVVTLWACHERLIRQEIEGAARHSGEPAWPLDASFTSLFTLLGYWDEMLETSHPGGLQVCCDESKPLEASYVQDLFRRMIGREDRHYSLLPDQDGNFQRVTFKLSEPISFRKSHETPGIQVADVLATAINYSLRNKEQSQCQEWMRLYQDSLRGGFVFPDWDELDFAHPSVRLNAIVLHELVDRTIKGESLLADMGEFIDVARRFVMSQEPNGRVGP